MDRIARLIVTALIAAMVLVAAPAHADGTFPPIPAPVYECAQAESYATAFNTSHRTAVAWSERALLAEAKLMAKRVKIQRMKGTVAQMRGRINRLEDRLELARER